jgi:hypothetical protein
MRRTLIRRQLLEGGDVGKLNRLSFLVTEKLVGIGLDPSRLGQGFREGFARVLPLAGTTREAPPRAALEDA